MFSNNVRVVDEHAAAKVTSRRLFRQQRAKRRARKTLERLGTSARQECVLCADRLMK
jgi:hypothetical protein